MLKDEMPSPQALKLWLVGVAAGEDGVDVEHS